MRPLWSRQRAARPPINVAALPPGPLQAPETPTRASKSLGPPLPMTPQSSDTSAEIEKLQHEVETLAEPGPWHSTSRGPASAPDA